MTVCLWRGNLTLCLATHSGLWHGSVCFLGVYLLFGNDQSVHPDGTVRTCCRLDESTSLFQRVETRAECLSITSWSFAVICFNLRYSKCHVNSVKLNIWAVLSYQVAGDMLHVIGTQLVACDLRMIAPWPLARMCWRQFVVQWDCEKILHCAFQCDYYYCYNYYYYYCCYYYYCYFIKIWTWYKRF